MIRKRVCLLLAALLVFCMASGCGSTNNSKGGNGDAPGQAGDSAAVTADWGKGGSVKTADGTVSVDPKKSLLSSVGTAGQQNTAEYTLMVYMIGSNLESEAACATQDIVEMAASGVDFSKVNVLVYAGGTSDWAIEIPSSCNSVLLLGQDSYSVVAQTKSRENMGDPQTFYDFLAYSFNHYPAEQYGLICWDHGGGPVLGYGSDELFDNDGLSVTEYKLAMDASPFGPNKKLAFVGYDACLMAGLEIADLWSDYAKYLIASTETEMGNGWDYSFLSAFNTTKDPLAISKACVDAFGANYDAYYQQNYGNASGLQMGLMYLAGSYPYATLSCMDLSKVDVCMSKWDALMTSLSENLDSVYPSLAQARAGVKSYGSSFFNDYDLIDLTDFLNRLPAPYNTMITGNDIRALVAYSTANTGNSNGVSLYFPYYWEDLYCSDIYQDYLQFTATDAYRGFLEKYTALRFGNAANGSSSTTANVSTTTNAAGKAIVEIPESMSNMLASATYTLLYAPNNDDCYLPILSDIPLELSDAGTLAIPDVTTVLGADECELPLTGRQLSSDGTTVSFAVGNLKLSGESGSRPVSIQTDLDTATGNVVLRSLVDDSTGYEPVGKSFALGEGWDTLSMECVSRCPTYGSDGELLPCSQWEKGSRSWNFGIALDSAASVLEAVPVNSLAGTLMVQAQLEDVYGNVLVTELVPVSNPLE